MSCFVWKILTFSHERHIGIEVFFNSANSETIGRHTTSSGSKSLNVRLVHRKISALSIAFNFENSTSSTNPTSVGTEGTKSRRCQDRRAAVTCQSAS